MDSYIGFIANQSGKYYVGVSSAINTSYSAIEDTNINQFQGNFVASDYDLNLNVVEVIPDQDEDNTISEAIAVQDQSSVFQGEILINDDIDVYEFTLEPDQGIRFKTRTANSDLDSLLPIFDEEGNELAFNDNTNPQLTRSFTTDSSLDFLPDNPGRFFIGLSSAGNFAYDVVNGDTNLNFLDHTGISQGNYELELEIEQVLADEDTDNTISEAINSNINSPEVNSTTVSGDIESELDIDIFKLYFRRNSPRNRGSELSHRNLKLLKLRG